MTRPRIFLVDDHRLLLESLERLLAEQCDVVGSATSVEELIGRLPIPALDCILLDLLMPGENGLVGLARIKAKQPQLKVIVVTMLSDRALAQEAVARGADGFIPKETGAEDLLVGISTVFKGIPYISPCVSKACHSVGLAAQHAALTSLTPRQHEILRQIGAGHSYAEIASQLHIARSTLTFHKNHVMARLGFTTDIDLKHFAMLLFVTPPPQAVCQADQTW